MILKNCPACGATSFKEVRRAPYFRGEREWFTIQECSSCGFWFTNPRPDETELGKYYQGENYISHSNSKRGVLDHLYHLVRTYTLKRKVALIGRYSKKGKLLDYGAGTGHFLKKAKFSGWNVTGVEQSESARSVANRVNGIELESPEVINIEPNSFEAITLWHVLEHLPNLNDHLGLFTRSLKKDGILVIAVPNHESEDSKYYGNSWAALDVPLHLYHFRKNDMKYLAKKHSLEVVDIKNMPFDSFYVSLLSEKIEHDKVNYMSAAWQGLKSNLKGFSDKNASSLIYILRKTQ